MKLNQVKWGAIISYVLIVVNAVYGMVISPYILSTIGSSEYGVYKTIGSLTATVAVLELGIGAMLQRYIARFHAEKKEKELSNFSAMGMIQAAVLAVLMLLVGVCLFLAIDPTYHETFSTTELVRAKQLFVLQLAYVVFHIFENALFGIISGYNRFVFINSVKLLAIIVRMALYFIVLPIFRSSLTIVTVSILIELLIICAELVFLRKSIGHKIHLYYWDKPLFKEAFIYMMLLFVQSIIIQFNGNIDNVVIGAVLGTTSVTVYSFAIQIFNMFETCATSISGVVLPTITNQIHAGATPKQLEATVVKFGRVQWMVLGMVLFGFICCGQEFFYLWLGEGFEDCWYLSLILMVPVTFPLIVNVCLAILKVKNLLTFRTISLAYSAVINVVLTVIGTHIWGYWAAAVGTAISTIVGSVISMNIYYQKKLGINIFRLYGKIIGKITACLILASVPCAALNRVLYGSWLSLCVKVAVFVVVYGAAMLLFGLNKAEKAELFRFKRRISK